MKEGEGPARAAVPCYSGVTESEWSSGIRDSSLMCEEWWEESKQQTQQVCFGREIPEPGGVFPGRSLAGERSPPARVVPVLRYENAKWDEHTLQGAGVLVEY